MGRKEQILQQAGFLFSQRGYHATSMRDLAKALGLQGGSLYAHIDSKESLLWDIVTLAADQFDEALAQALQGPGHAALKLEAALVAHLEVITRNLPLATVFFHEWKHLPPERYHAVALRRDRVEEVYRDLLRQGIAEGLFRPDLDVALSTKLLLSSVNWVYHWYNPSGPRSASEIARANCRLLLEGLLLAPPSR